MRWKFNTVFPVVRPHADLTSGWSADDIQASDEQSFISGAFLELKVLILFPADRLIWWNKMAFRNVHRKMITRKRKRWWSPPAQNSAGYKRWSRNASRNGWIPAPPVSARLSLLHLCVADSRLRSPKMQRAVCWRTWTPRWPTLCRSSASAAVNVRSVCGARCTASRQVRPLCAPKKKKFKFVRLHVISSSPSDFQNWQPRRSWST